MKKNRTSILAAMSLAIASSVASTQTSTSPTQPVTVESYNRAQSDVYFAGLVKGGGFGKFQHAHALQNAIKVKQESPGAFEVPNWDEGSLKKVKTALLQLGTTITDTRRMYGANESEVDPVKHLIGTAMLWGGNREKDALYLP